MICKVKVVLSIITLHNGSSYDILKNINLVYQAASMPFVRMVGKEKAEDVIGHTDKEIF
jgi:hypothetical protein